jgi:hypothetical protein
MSWASCIALPHRRRSRTADTRRRDRSILLRLERAQYVAGDTVAGTVGGLAGDRISLVRVERRPHHRRELEIAEARMSQPAGAFRLTVPDAALPTTAGDLCSLGYLVRARDADAAASTDLVVVATAHPHLADGSWPPDRLLANWDARHFHIELYDAELHGGGRLSGRVHRHGIWAHGTIVVNARCLECWTASAPGNRGAPLWHANRLWEQAHPLPVDSAATWAPFDFELPDWLPQAVEASTIAWRYELIAQRSVPCWFDETAALTPLLFEQPWPTDVLASLSRDG